MSTPKIALFANTDWYLYNFRINLARRLRDSGCEVLLICPRGPYCDRLRAAGFRHIPFDFSTRSTNPLRELMVILRLVSLLHRERPDLLHNFTIKCVLYGSIASRFVGQIPVVNAVTGLGHIFLDQGWKARLLRPLIKTLYQLVIFRVRGGRVIFQNDEDLEGFASLGCVDRQTARLVRGSGVDCQMFRPAGDRSPAPMPRRIRVLFASRLLREKGVFELIRAARLLKHHGTPVSIDLAGECWPDNPSSLTPADIEAVKCEGVVGFLGHIEEMPALLAGYDIVVLPSYREGTPKVLLEAAAMGKPLIATDVPGCRGVVQNGINGLLVPPKDATALAQAIEVLVCDHELRVAYGRAGRQLMLDRFEESIVLDSTLEIYGELISLPRQS
jgi:glycosyltransferase involved in cell wall biosynthesis